MKRLNYRPICFIIIVQSCGQQINSPNEIYNKDFNWTIAIPDNFENVGSEQWAKMQNRGADAIEKTYGEEIINRAKTIFVFKSDQLNYFESNYQPFDTATDGDYLESCKNVSGISYETFRAQMPGIKIDTTRMVDKIDNLEFQMFKKLLSELFCQSWTRAKPS